MVTGQSLGARRGIRMLERRVLVVLAIISVLSACATNKEFSFENIYDDVVSLLTVDSDGTVTCLLYTSPSPRDRQKSRMPSSA